MEWSSTQITWDLQVMVLWYVLPPIFVLCGLLTLALPPLLASRQGKEDKRQSLPASNLQQSHS